MTTITMRYNKGTFLVTGEDIEARRFASRREAKDWCVKLYPGSPIHEIGADASKRLTRAMPRKKPLRRRDPRTAETKNPPESDGSQKAWAKLGEVP
jgi:hypothetical protein